jgi:hypothetical protein
MTFSKFAILPAALAMSVAFASVALAGPDKNHGDGGGPDKNHGDGGNGGGPDKNHGDGGNGGGPDKNPNPAPAPTPRPNPAPVNLGGGNGDGYPRDVLCRLEGRIIYTRTERQCRKLQRELGANENTVVLVKERKRLVKRKVKVQQVVVVEPRVEYVQPQPVVRYVAEPSRAARMQMERRARKDARRAAYAGDGGVVAYGNGVVVGGYNNTVVVNGNVYGGGQVVTTGKKRKGKKARRVVVQTGTYYNYGDCTCAQ